MFLSWRYQLREAEWALRDSRIEQAAGILTESDLRQYLPGKRLADKVADALVQRARRHLLVHNDKAAWDDLETAQKLIPNSSRFRSLNDDLVEYNLNRAEEMIIADNLVGAVSQLEHLLCRIKSNDRAEQLLQDIRRVNVARAFSKKGASGKQEEPTSKNLATYFVSEDAIVTTKHSDRRFLLWVDAVGGYLVCLGDEIMLGQAVPDANVDVPLLGDLSRRHAKIIRQEGQYILDPFQPVKIEGQQIHSATLLNDCDEIELGSSVRLRFRKPHALSASARLDFLSHHRTQPWADAVLLMADSCVLGPNWHNHVTCRDWPDDVVLYREGKQIYCRASDKIEIDGQLCDGRGKVTYNSHITGVDFSLSLEEI